MEIYQSARKHGVADGDIRHAVEGSLVAYPLDDGTELIIHAMRMRPKYRDLLL